jgi:hypothetical protein
MGGERSRCKGRPISSSQPCNPFNSVLNNQLSLAMYPTEESCKFSLAMYPTELSCKRYWTTNKALETHRQCCGSAACIRTSSQLLPSCSAEENRTPRHGHCALPLSPRPPLLNPNGCRLLLLHTIPELCSLVHKYVDTWTSKHVNPPNEDQAKT